LGAVKASLLVGTQTLANLGPLAEASDILSGTRYMAAFRNALNLGAIQNYFDIQVGQAFVQRWKEIKTGNLKSETNVALKVTRDIEKIFGFRDVEINASADGQTLHVAIDERAYKLTEVGSGLTQFILVLANAATQSPSYILIDEPELNLHPSLQLDFLTSLGSYATKGIVFSTHSIGLAQSAADWIYSVSRSEDGLSRTSEWGSTPRLSELLGELSFSGYKELGFDKVLLVEGPTDVKTIQQFLRFYKKNQKIVLLQLGGNAMINDRTAVELGEIKRISANVSALIDSERAAQGAPPPPNREQFVGACQRTDIFCHMLERRAIENYFTDSAVKKVKGNKYRALKPFEKLNEVSPGWSKQENWRVAEHMTKADLDGTDLGAFLSAL